MEALAPILVTTVVFLVIGWIIQSVLSHRRQMVMAKLQGELHSRLIDKFGTSQELVGYLESEAGRQFLRAAPVEQKGPFGRILSSIQAGVILTLAGGAFLYLRGQVVGGDEAFAVLGTVCLALGIGFLLSSAATFGLSKAWGLIDGKKALSESRMGA